MGRCVYTSDVRVVVRVVVWSDGTGVESEATSIRRLVSERTSWPRTREFYVEVRGSDVVYGFDAD